MCERFFHVLHDAFGLILCSFARTFDLFDECVELCLGCFRFGLRFVARRYICESLVVRLRNLLTESGEGFDSSFQVERSERVKEVPYRVLYCSESFRYTADRSAYVVERVAQTVDDAFALLRFFVVLLLTTEPLAESVDNSGDDACEDLKRDNNELSEEPAELHDYVGNDCEYFADRR